MNESGELIGIEILEVDSFLLDSILESSQAKILKLKNRITIKWINIDIYFIQPKNQDSLSEDVIQKFNSSAEDILNLEKSVDSLTSVYNNKLLDHVSLFRKLDMDNITKQPNLNFYCRYASKGVSVHSNGTSSSFSCN